MDNKSISFEETEYMFRACLTLVAAAAAAFIVGMWIHIKLVPHPL